MEMVANHAKWEDQLQDPGLSEEIYKLKHIISTKQQCNQLVNEQTSTTYHKIHSMHQGILIIKTNNCKRARAQIQIITSP